MKTFYSLTVLFFLMLLNSYTMAQTDKQLVGYWSHYDVVNRLGSHVTVEMKPFSLQLNKNHRFEMNSEGMQAKGTWSLNNAVLVLNIASTEDRQGRIQKLYIEHFDRDSLVTEVRDVEITGGLMIVMKRTSK